MTAIKEFPVVNVLTWREEQGFLHCRLSEKTLLRIAYQHLPYSFGTTSYCKLQLLTVQGWEDLHVVTFKEGGKEVMMGEAAQEQVKSYAQFLYGPGIPVGAEGVKSDEA